MRINIHFRFTLFELTIFGKICNSNLNMRLDLQRLHEWYGASCIPGYSQVWYLRRPCVVNFAIAELPLQIGLLVTSRAHGRKEILGIFQRRMEFAGNKLNIKPEKK